MSLPNLSTVAMILREDGSVAYQIQSQQYDTDVAAQAGLATLSASLMELGLITNIAISYGWNGVVTNQRLSTFLAEAMEHLRKLTEAVRGFYQEINSIVTEAETTLEDVDLERLRTLRASMKAYVPANN